uniref:Calpain catalytic domain-containing protein n=1 Tax=Kwoniella bestiolae CBS 10118 TaxID=1296100 RepID=A0A1B9FXR5_9TREE|nr:hypothetical protein I302_06540 [Kwoniella bestiolae CBS 10118]OCF23557.1 hypothetical protein I302_06540 [Kwoniella bestiolae CBS 10118]
MLNNLLFSLILSASLAVKATPLYKRDAGPLFGPSGLPSPDDLQQLKSLLTFEGDYNSVQEVTATCWTLPVDKEGKVPEVRKPRIRVEDVKHRNDSKTDIWWPGALYQAPIHEGIAVDPEGQGGMPSLGPGEAMTMVTGKRAEGRDPKDLEDFCRMVLKVDDSPMILHTKSEGTATLWGKHAYAITKAVEESPGNRMVNLINTDGKREHLMAEVVFPDTLALVNWVGYPSFVNERAP